MELDDKSIKEEDSQNPLNLSVNDNENMGNQPRFEIKKWNAVAVWSWDLLVDNCAICRNHIMDSCIECQTNATNSEAEKCGVSWGVCNHGFHNHCISKWLKTRNVCPLDNQPWEFNHKYT